MTLQQIDQRLTLFKEYMRYRIDKMVDCRYSALNTLTIFGLTGIMMLPDKEDVLLTFDVWLLKNQHHELADMVTMLNDRNVRFEHNL